MSDFEFLKNTFLRLREMEQIYGKDPGGKCSAASAALQATIKDYLKTIRKEPSHDN